MRNTRDLVVLTLTGDRSVPLALCRRWLQRQNYPWAQWLVVDDGGEPSLLGKDDPRITHVLRERQPDDPPHTLRRNLAVALDHIPQDATVVMFEDDDWYAPNYLRSVVKWMEFPGEVVMFGQMRAHYYRVANRQYSRLHNDAHSSLCATAFVATREVMQVLRELTRPTNHNPFLDLDLWRDHRIDGKCLIPHDLVIGMKQLPGRPGSTYGWRGGSGFLPDPDGAILRKLVGEEDAQLYLKFGALVGESEDDESLTASPLASNRVPTAHKPQPADPIRAAYV